MEHKDRAIKAEMLKSEIEEIKANLESLKRHLASAEGPARAQYEADRDETREELKTREAELEQVLKGGDGADSAAIKAEMLRNELADAEENLRGVEGRINLASGPARELYQKERDELNEEIARLRKEIGG